MKRNMIRLLLLCAALVLSAALCTGCGQDQPKLDDYFSQEQIDEWKLENKDKELKYTMNGGYFLCFQGQYYPVEFNDGCISWPEPPPFELLFITMNELFTDAKLKNRCAYLGLKEHAVLFQTDCQHAGYILDGKRPDYGSVLYVDETDLRYIDLDYGATGAFAADEVIQIKTYAGTPLEKQLAVGRILLTDEGGTFLEGFDTFREILTYAKESGIPFDGRTKYSGLPYPSSLLEIADDQFWEDADADHTGGWMKVYEIEMKPYYRIVISYDSNANERLNCLVFTSDGAKEETYEQIRFDDENPSSWADFKNPVWDENGELVSCYVVDFHEVNIGETATKFFNSIPELQAFLQEQRRVNTETKTAISYFGTSEGKLDPLFDFQNLYSALWLHAVWEPYHVVNLYNGDAAEEVILCKEDTLVLQPAMRPGYEFAGWYASADFSGDPITQLHGGDTYENLYASFRQVDHYTLTFQEYEGKTMESIQYVYGEVLQLPKLTKAFHIFKGWCVDAECKTRPITEINTEFYGSYHLYPCFEARKYTITLHYGEQVKDIEVAYGMEFATTLGVTGAGFLGYFDENGVQYTDENGKSLAPFTDGADIALFAKYKEE